MTLVAILFLIFFVVGCLTAFVGVPAPWERVPWVCVFACLFLLALRVFAL